MRDGSAKLAAALAVEADHECSEALPAQDWHAQLSLTLAQRRGGTVLASARHEGPLRVQRPFYPEGPQGPCHVYVLHPPGGIVSGDRLRIDVQAGAESHGLLTAPGANKLYRARAAASASLVQHVRVESGATVEWLPPEIIAFAGTRAALRTHVELAEDACYAGWEILCLGRPAAQESFDHGELDTELRISRSDKLVYLERGRYRGGEALLRAPWGLRGLPVLATFVVAAPRIDASWVEQVRERVPCEDGTFAVTLVSGLLIARYLGASTLAARALFERAYDVLRPLYAARPAVHPRIWST